ncbi:MAG: glycosyltransferase family 2 protein [Candidatus Diapherotrites archaeon]|nr:glycosyltransferase family 2 protein [Candidatus Diapherotrites archaeon]
MQKINCLVVMVPCYNEEKTIGTLIKLVPKRIQGVGKIKILIINDGSSDGTVEEAKKAGATKVHSHYPNRGLGITFREGIWEALKMGADVVVNIDADLQFNPKDIPALIKPIQEGKAEVATCTRFGKEEFAPKMPFMKKIGNSFFTKTVSIILKQKFTDTQCGFRAYTKEACLRMNLFGKFTYTQEVFLDLVNKGMKIVEVPLKVKGERDGKSRIVKSWYSYGIRSMLIIVRSIRDNYPLKFFGSIGTIVFLSGFLPGAWLFARWVLIGKTSPYQSLILVSATLMILGFLLLILALLADLQDRQRKMMEEIIYNQKKEILEKQAK